MMIRKSVGEIVPGKMVSLSIRGSSVFVLKNNSSVDKEGIIIWRARLLLLLRLTQGYVSVVDDNGYVL